jgi:hypothetical protein
MWILVSLKLQVGYEDAGYEDWELQRTRLMYGLGGTTALHPCLLYVCIEKSPTGKWISVLGENPVPTVTGKRKSASLEASAIAIGVSLSKVLPQAELPADVSIRMFSMLIDMQQTDWCLMDFRCGDIPCGRTSVSVAGHILGSLMYLSLRKVCRSWNAALADHHANFPKLLMEGLQLHGKHGQPIAPLREIIRLFMEASSGNMLPMTANPSFKNFVWPLRVTSVNISTAGSFSDTRNEHWLAKLAKPFAAFSRDLLHDIPLPWIKCLQGVHDRPGGVPVKLSINTSSANGQDTNTICLGFLNDSYLRGAQSLHTTTELLVGPNGIVTRAGATLSDRLPTAFKTLRDSLPNGSVLTPVAESQTWISRIDEAEQRRRSCICQRYMGDGTNFNDKCIRCKDGRNWSYLLAAKAFKFAYVSGPDAESHEVSFTIEGRVLPFLSTSDDELIRRDIADTMQTVGLAITGHDSELEEDSLQDGSDNEEESLDGALI